VLNKWSTCVTSDDNLTKSVCSFFPFCFIESFGCYVCGCGFQCSSTFV
jgi:hypothetical protein